MPNWVYNNMGVAGSLKDLEIFRQKAEHEGKELSYWNFITPPEEALDSGEYYAENGFDANGRFGNTPNNWYNWNNREWGVKWDASDVTLDTTVYSLDYSWSSPWGHPEPVFIAMVEQHPELTFEFSWQEEQGWGGEASGSDGIYAVQREWDIPDSHADNEAIDRMCSCQAFPEDPEYFYADCPKPEEVSA